MTPYAGNPDNFPEDISEFSGDPPNETNFNTPVEGLADRTAWLKARALGGACEFRPVVASTDLLASPDNGFITCVRWDSSLRAWIVGGMSLADGTGNTTVFRVPNGYSDGSLGGAPNVSSNQIGAGVPFDALYDGTHYVTAYLDTSDHVHIGYCSPGGAWAGPYSDTSATFVHATLHELPSGQILLAYSSATTTHFFYSNDHGVTWTDTTYALASYTGGVGELLVDNGSLALLIASANKSTYLTGTDGAGLWTVRSVPWGTDVPMGATYARDSVGPCFYVVTKPGGGGMNTWKSRDGISWVQVGGLEPGFSPQSMASVQGVLAVAADISGGLTRGVYVSLDYGATWKPAVNSPVVDSTPFAGLRPIVAASDSQWMCAWQASTRVSAVFFPPTGS